MKHLIVITSAGTVFSNPVEAAVVDQFSRWLNATWESEDFESEWFSLVDPFGTTTIRQHSVVAYKVRPVVEGK